MLILASASKARRTLLDNAGISYKAIISGYNEELISKVDAQETVQLLSKAKADVVVSKISSKFKQNSSKSNESMVLGCDSIFEFRGEAFGKPKSKNEAVERLTRMAGNFGILHTGHALRFSSKSEKDFPVITYDGLLEGIVSTKVHFVKASKKDIENYVNTGEPMQCAGCFALEGKGSLFIEKIDGCFSNVIGLSLPWLREAMKKTIICQNII